MGFTRKISTLALLFCLLQSPLSFGWGNEGHTAVDLGGCPEHPNHNATLFAKLASAEIAYLGPEPDRWRSPSEFALKNAQEADHFIDLERVDWMNPLPAGRYEFYRKLYEKRASTQGSGDDYLPEHVGLQPYITMEVFGRLKAAFREYRHLRYSTSQPSPLRGRSSFTPDGSGHYVGDGSQPLHTTVSYNGWVGPNPSHYSTEPGIHWRFEGPYVAANIHANDFARMVHAPEHLADPFHQYLEYLEDSHKLVERVYELDQAGGFKEKGSPEARTFTEQRLAGGITDAAEPLVYRVARQRRSGARARKACPTQVNQVNPEQGSSLLNWSAVAHSSPGLA